MVPDQSFRLIRSQDLSFICKMDVPRDITGWTITFQVRDSLGGTSRITKTVGSGITISNAGRGEITITLDKADTSSLAIQSYVWDIKRTTSGSNVTLARGELTLEQEVTT